MAATGSEEDLRNQLLQLMVPTLADSCVVLLPADQGKLRAALVGHRDPVRAAILEQLRDVDIPAEGPLLHAVLTQASTQVATDVSRLTHGGTPARREVMGILRRAGFDSMLVTPLLIGERTAGAVVLGRDAGRSRFTQTDVAVFEELGRRLAAGWANVETFAREHTVAETLQRALLPDCPPEIAGLDVAVRYLPATGGVQVGGDWYDVFPLCGSQVGLAIGDVVGHSIGSASIMGQVRSMLRSYTVEHPAPADVLRSTNVAVCRLLPDAVATAFYAVLDLSTGDLAYANAGHPPALLDSGDGHVDYLDGASGAMLGASADTAYTASHGSLASGARLLLYTDGLIEDRRRDIAVGFSDLAAAMRRSLTQTAERTCQCAQSAMLGSGTRADDVCILAVHRQDAGLSPAMNLVRADREDDADLVAASVPRVRATQVTLGKSLDVFRAALGGGIDDPPADLVVARGIGRIGNGHGDPWIAVDVLDLLEALDSVDDDMLAIGVDPRLGHLG